MATVKVKFCPSSVTGKTGTVYYQLTHRREKQQIASDICLLPDGWEKKWNALTTGADMPSLLPGWSFGKDAPTGYTIASCIP